MHDFLVEAEVFYADYGTRDIVRTEGIKVLDKIFCEIPYQAIQVALPIDADSDAAVRAKIEDRLVGSESLTFTEVSPDSHTYSL